MTLYEADFVLWSKEQASALRQAARSGANLPVDWEHVAEEIESLGVSQKHELRSRIGVIIEHLLKLECSTAKAPRAGWMDTIDRERDEIEHLLVESPSLRSSLADVIAAELSRMVRATSRSFWRHGEGSPDLDARLRAAARYGENQVLGDWFPDEPAS